ncbi:MAG: 50S ribosomal protein L18 [Candidatus Aenigmatarchaeota archaeon]|nr:50S ribosomal protein L18 [Candidatus Aenigmarchaeota archaeon]
MRMQFRRRREQKTNYHARLTLIKSGKPRMVVRTSISHATVQFIKWYAKGDMTIASATTAELHKFGWKPPTGNVPAAYLVGLLAGMRAKAAGISAAVLDIGLATSTPGSRLYAALKGVLDTGINVPHSSDMLPSEDRINGKHIAEFALSAQKPAFSKYGISASELPKHVAEVKAKIMQAKG